MAENTAISWADHTWNPWIGCTKVGPACDGCYAENLMATRMGRVTWGKPGQRATHSRTSEAYWKQPLKWEREAVAAWRAHDDELSEWNMAGIGERALPKPPAPVFVFCASLADVFDKDVPTEWRRDLFDLIRATPHLTWLLLTKRPQMIERLYREVTTANYAAEKPGPQGWPRNAAIGCTVVTQVEADRDIPHLLRAKAALKPAFAFLSMEPLLQAVDLTRVDTLAFPGAERLDALTGVLSGLFGDPCSTRLPPLDWVITGGETDQGGHKARPSWPGWFASIRDQCAAAGVAYHHKQNGEWNWTGTETFDGAPHPIYRVGKKAAGRLLDGVEHNDRPAVRHG